MHDSKEENLKPVKAITPRVPQFRGHLDAHPVKPAMLVTMNYPTRTGSKARQSMAITLETVGDILRFLTLPTDGSLLLLKRSGQAFGLDDRIYSDLLQNEDVFIVSHPGK